MRAQAKAIRTRRINRISGSGVLTKLTSREDTSPIRHRVIKSPKHAAMGGAMLSGNTRSELNAESQ